MTMIRSKSATGARIVEIEKRIRSFANIRPIKPYSTLLDSSPLKKKLLKVILLFFRIDWRSILEKN
jgi:hypothetical protein